MESLPQKELCENCDTTFNTQAFGNSRKLLELELVTLPVAVQPNVNFGTILLL